MADEIKKCPYCAEMIRAEAAKCRYCGSMLDGTRSADPHEGHWCRVNAGKKVAGVCTGLAREFNSPQAVLPLRIFFVLSTLFYSFGIILYILLWMLMPAPADNPPVAASPPPEPPGASHRAGPESPGTPRQHRDSHSSSTLVSLILILAGITFMLLTFTRGQFFLHPLRDMIGYPGFLFHNLTWYPGLWFALIVAGLLIILLGTMKVFRVLLGCGLIVVGGFLFLVFMPFVPKLVFLPVMLVVGMLLLLIGIIKMIV